MNTTLLHIQGMHCTSCALNVDFTLEDLPGVSESHTHYANQQCRIVYDSQVTSVKALISAINQLGYQAEEITNS